MLLHPQHGASAAARVGGGGGAHPCSPGRDGRAACSGHWRVRWCSWQMRRLASCGQRQRRCCGSQGAVGAGRVPPRPRAPPWPERGWRISAVGGFGAAARLRVVLSLFLWHCARHLLALWSAWLWLFSDASCLLALERRRTARFTQVQAHIIICRLLQRYQLRRDHSIATHLNSPLASLKQQTSVGG